jgi:arginyl-tRNA synthetase
MPDDKPAADGAKPAGDTKPEEVKKEESKKEESKKPKIGKMKTREGDSTKLMDLLDEAKNRTMDIFRERMKEEEDADGVKSKV